MANEIIKRENALNDKLEELRRAWSSEAGKIRFDVYWGVDIGKRSYSVYTQYGEMAARMPASAQIVEGEVISKKVT